MDDIKALIFHSTVHQDFESIPVLVCKCSIILALRFFQIKLNPTWWHKLHYWLISI